MKKHFVILFLLVFVIFISGCINILPTLEDDSIAPGKGRLKIYLTDSSEKYKVNGSENYIAVNINISKIQVHLAGEDGEDEGEWIWVLDEWAKYDLIKLKDAFELISDRELDQGKYIQLRLFVIEPTVSVEIEKTGEDSKLIEIEDVVPFVTFDVEIPSADQTGIKLIHPFEVIEGETAELTIDFDAEKSIVKTDKGEYKLKPVIKIITVYVEEVDEEE